MTRASTTQGARDVNGEMKPIRDLHSGGNGVTTGARPGEGGGDGVGMLPAYERIGAAAPDVRTNLTAKPLEETRLEPKS